MTPQRYTVTQVAKLVGKSARTLKRLESAGAIPLAGRDPRTNYRVYSAEDVETLQAILYPEAGARTPEVQLGFYVGSESSVGPTKRLELLVKPVPSVKAGDDVVISVEVRFKDVRGCTLEVAFDAKDLQLQLGQSGTVVLRPTGTGTRQLPIEWKFKAVGPAVGSEDASPISWVTVTAKADGLTQVSTVPVTIDKEAR